LGLSAISGDRERVAFGGGFVHVFLIGFVFLFFWGMRVFVLTIQQAHDFFCA